MDRIARGAQRARTPTGHEDADAQLSLALERARGGDELAFTTVFRAVQPGLLRYLTALVGAEAEDVASETWSQACRDLHKFRGDIDGFRGWIARIGRNRAIDHARAQRRRPQDTMPAEFAPDVPSLEDAADQAAEAFSTKAAIAAIAALPRDQAEAVLLRAVMGLDAEAAAKVLGKRAGAVRTAAHRGLRTLASTLDGLQTTTPSSSPTTRCNTFGPPNADGVR